MNRGGRRRCRFAPIAFALAGLGTAAALTGCSSMTNVIAGLTTPQSTISGSNYVFLVDPETGDLTPFLEQKKLGANINSNDSFAIAFDLGFVRYLQAVDPYVIAYSEAWMGNDPAPTDEKEKLRQVFLLRDGLGQNSRLPVISIPILGPVTMGDDLLPVTALRSGSSSFPSRTTNRPSV
jgi:hypothetical protein